MTTTDKDATCLTLLILGSNFGFYADCSIKVSFDPVYEPARFCNYSADFKIGEDDPLAL